MTHYTIIPIKTDGVKYRQMFYMVDIGQQQMILGFKWLKKIKPEIHWDTGKLSINSSSGDRNDHWIRTIEQQERLNDHEWIRDICKGKPKPKVLKSQIKINLLKKHWIRHISAMDLA